MDYFDFNCEQDNQKASQEATKNTASIRDAKRGYNKVYQKTQQIRTTRPRHNHVTSADPTIVYILGTIDGQKYIEEHSGINGFIIRSIPAYRRWTNPVLIGAGHQRLAVVDRISATSDVIRVTNKYAGAPAASFDGGTLYDAITWETLTDDFTIPMPTGYRVTGLKILDQDILIACLDPNDGSETTCFYTYDFQGYSDYNRLVTLDAPFTCGIATGMPSEFDITQTRHFPYVLITTKRRDGSSGDVLLINWEQGKVVKSFGLPIGWIPLSVGSHGFIINVVCKNTAEEKKTFRFLYNEDSNTIDMPVFETPDSVEIDKTFSEQDDNDSILTAGIRSVEYDTFDNIKTDYDENRTQGRVLPTGSTTASKNNNRTIVTENHTVSTTNSAPGESTSDASTFSVVDSEDEIVLADTSANTVVEGFRYTTDEDVIDEDQPLFRAVHGTFYDYLSDGGYSYECNNDSEQNAFTALATATGEGHLTSGIDPVHMAVDCNAELGTPQELQDLRIVVVDSATGYLLYPYPKPLGVRVLFGTHLMPEPVSVVSRTRCTETNEVRAERIDGVSRPATDDLQFFTYNFGGPDIFVRTPINFKSENYPTNYSNSQYLDNKYTYFLRRVKAPSPITFRLGFATKSVYAYLPAFNNLQQPIEDGRGNQLVQTDGSFCDEFDGLTTTVSGSGSISMLIAANPYLPAPTAPSINVYGEGAFFMPALPFEIGSDVIGDFLQLPSATTAHTFSPIAKTRPQKLTDTQVVEDTDGVAGNPPPGQTAWSLININSQKKGLVVPSDNIVLGYGVITGLKSPGDFYNYTSIEVGSPATAITGSNTDIGAATQLLWFNDSVYTSGLGTLIDRIDIGLRNLFGEIVWVNVYDQGDCNDEANDLAGWPGNSIFRLEYQTLTFTDINGSTATVTLDEDFTLAPLDVSYWLGNHDFSIVNPSVGGEAYKSLSKIVSITGTARVVAYLNAIRMIALVRDDPRNPDTGSWTGYHGIDPTKTGIARNIFNAELYIGTVDKYRYAVRRSKTVVMANISATITMASTDPYADIGLLMGRALWGEVNTQLNATLLNYRIETR